MRRTLPLNEWVRGQPPEATGFFKIPKKKDDPPGIICVGCEQRVPLWDEMDQCFASPEIQKRVRGMQGRQWGRSRMALT